MTEDIQERVEKQFYVYIFRSLKNEKTRYYWHKGRKERSKRKNNTYCLNLRKTVTSTELNMKK